MSNEELITIEAQQKAQEVEALAETYQCYQIITTEAYVASAEDLKIIKLKYKELDDLRKSLTKPLDESKKRIMEFFKKPLDYLSMAESSIKRALLKWQQEQDKIRRAEEKRLLEAQKKEAERLQRLAEAAKARGAEEKAEEFKERIAEVQSVIPVVAPKVEKVSGIQTKTIWKYRILDVNIIPREYLIPNEKMLGELARTTKGSVEITGIKFYPEEVIAAGR